MIDESVSLKIDRRSTAEQVAEVLREQILSGALSPGSPLREVPLAESFGISRNTMRESIRHLVYEGLARHSMHRGTCVTALSEDDVADIFRVRRTLELAAVDRLRQGGKLDLALLSACVDNMEEAVAAQDWVRSVECDMRFHRALVALLGSERLGQFYDTLLQELRLGLVLVDRAEAGLEALVDDHRELCRLLSEGPSDVYEKVIADHLQESETKVRATVARFDRGGTR